MKKYNIILNGKISIIESSENKAIEKAEQELKAIHNKFNIDIFAISEANREHNARTK